ncbi:hypothetical protein KBA27_00100 [bacterium]|nr:hypothetical protein [bacterium]
MQTPTVQPQLASTYNAVKIDVNNPTVNAPQAQQPEAPAQACCSAPIYSVPKQSVYEVPSQSIYTPTATKAQAPAVPAPVIVPTAPAPTTDKAPATPAPQAAAAPQEVEVKAPECPPSTSSLDLTSLNKDLKGTDLDAQEKALEHMANTVQNSPEQAKDLLDPDVMTNLTNIIQADTTKADAQNKAKAEQNKTYAIYTTAMLQKVYGDNVEKMNNTVVPLTELPGAAVIVEQLKSNPNPAVRAASIDSLSYVQRPEYKKDLNTIFTLAQKDKDASVQQAVNAALDKLAKLPDAVSATDEKKA